MMAKGLYFEDIVLGWEITTKGRTITEADVVNFAGLSGDFNPLHVDAEFASQTEFGQRIAHGALGLSIATGLTYQAGFMEDTVMAFLNLEWKYSAPVFFGDTIHCEVKVIDLKLMRRLGGGKVVLDVKIVNQDGKVVQKGEWTVLVRSRPEDAPAQ
jgi:acyl dehydratase